MAPYYKKPIASIVIPAHNEQAVISRCLTGLLKDSFPGELEILVVCNGCTDNTAGVAATFGPDVRVLQCPVASKIAALNFGDHATGIFPRIYLDADIAVDTSVIRKTVEALNNGTLTAAPSVRFDTRLASWPVQAFYKVWALHPYFDHAMIGSGFYAVSQEGRKRWENFPQITADDAFVLSQFEEHERQTVSNCEFSVSTPTNLSDLIKIKTRSRRGNKELKTLDIKRFTSKTPRWEFAAKLLAQPLLWVSCVIYAWVVLLTTIRAAKTAQSRAGLWERDDSSRRMTAS
jgi:glycosyltransferase involved in cell wall biosynthesis